MNVLRWIGVFPASIVGMYVCYLFSMLSGYLNFGCGITINGETINVVGAIVSILANGFAGYGFVYCGAYVAPSHKAVTALILMIILVIGVILGIYQDFSLGRATILETIRLLVNPIGSYIAFESIKEDVIANLKTPERPMQYFGESREDYMKRVNEYKYKESVNRTRNSTFERNPSICIDIDGCKIMLKEDFIKREWYKTKEGGIPVRGQYEPAAHYLKRIDEYRKMKAEQKRNYDEKLARKKHSILGRCAKAPLPKSEYEADEILKNYNGEK
ncbi:MAG: hypothetical protein MSB11_05210 [Prevotella sp.]|nr:hypothetical protein [Prevotella sp.]